MTSLEQATREMLLLHRRADAIWDAYLRSQQIACPEGCTECCDHFFPVWPAEIPLVFEGLRRLGRNAETLADVAARHAEMERELRRRRNIPLLLSRVLEPDREAAAAEYVVLLGGIREPCMMLGPHGCQIYELRPILCRLYGYPTPSNPDNVCEKLIEPLLERSSDGRIGVVAAGVVDSLKRDVVELSERCFGDKMYDFSTVAAIAENFLQSKIREGGANGL